MKVLEEAARAMCSWCDNGNFGGHRNELQKTGEVWHHKVTPPLDDSGRAFFRCDAGPIHDLIASKRDAATE